MPARFHIRPPARLRAFLATLPVAFARDRRGVVALILGLAILPLMALMGIAFDYSRANVDRATFQAAVDSGVVAGASINIPDEQRTTRATDAFKTMLTGEQRARLATVSGTGTNPTFSMDGNKTTVTGTARIQVQTQFRLFTSQQYIEQTITATARIARPQVRQLDLVMCIDGTGSMTQTINAVKTNALNFEANINAELTRRGLPAFDAMRVRPVFYRDYGGNYYFNPDTGGWAITSTSFFWVSNTDPDRGKYVGDIPPMDVSNFYSLPDQRTLFSTTVNAESAWGGGDEPESGLECVNEGLNSPFAKVGDRLANGKALTGVIPVVVVWTDANAHPPNHAWSLKNPLYPGAGNMPRTHAGLLAKWNDASKIDQTNKLLVFFGGPSTTGTAMDPQGWPPVQAWPNYFYGGTLAAGNSQMITRIVDAISTKFAQPTITH